MTQDISVALFGASGHAKVVLDILEHKELPQICGLFDDNQALWGHEIFGYPIFGGKDALQMDNCQLIVSIGDNEIRNHLAQEFQKRGYVFAMALHPSASISKGVSIGVGTVMMAGTVVNADTRIGEHVIINTCASVDHDCVVGTACHIAPGARICGGVTIGARTLIGAGAVVLPNMDIGHDVVVGAGAVVVENVPDGVTVVGIPARIFED